jgi:hypothetical protein
LATCAAEVGRPAGLVAGMLGAGAALGVLEQAMRVVLASAGARLLGAALAGEDGMPARTPGAAAAGRLSMRAAGKRR